MFVFKAFSRVVKVLDMQVVLSLQVSMENDAQRCVLPIYKNNMKKIWKFQIFFVSLRSRLKKNV